MKTAFFILSGGESITMEPMACTVDDETYRIIDEWFGRELSGKLLYDPPDEGEGDAAT